ncbi:MAG TPA: hypothetical protein VFU05_13845 [Cyclobacteriaceae bacterium]|nr:hypothetical protein [Cyclobacteriaceae bacterium]
MHRFFIIIFIIGLSCSAKRTDEYTYEERIEDLNKRGVTSDTCSFCALDSFLVESTNQDIETKIIITQPVAIELLDRTELMHKYHDTDYDTLMKLFKMKHAGDRNEIYRLSELYGYYTQGIKPVLMDNSVTIIDTIKHEQYITIKDKDKNYVIDLTRYRKDDGVLMFKPGKRPIYWTMKKDEDNCYGYYGFPKWYYNCR